MKWRNNRNVANINEINESGKWKYQWNSMAYQRRNENNVA
jgi:hypothetical protein